MPRPQQLPRFQPRVIQRQQQCTCSTTTPQNRQQFNPIGDRCSCGNSAVVPAVRPPCSCQVGQNNNRNNAIVVPRLPSRRNRVGRGMLGLFGLRGALAQLGSPGVGGISLNSRVLPRPVNNANSIVREPVNENENDDDNSITT